VPTMEKRHPGSPSSSSPVISDGLGGPSSLVVQSRQTLILIQDCCQTGLAQGCRAGRHSSWRAGPHDAVSHRRYWINACRRMRADRAVGANAEWWVSRGPWAGAAAWSYGRGVRISRVLIDIDGVLTVSWQPLPGRWRRYGSCAWQACRWPWLPTPPPSRGRRLRPPWPGQFPGHAADIHTAPAIAAAYLNDHYPGARCLLLNSGPGSDHITTRRLPRGVRGPTVADA
jgi:hypothetical protein